MDMETALIHGCSTEKLLYTDCHRNIAAITGVEEEDPIKAVSPQFLLKWQGGSLRSFK